VGAIPMIAMRRWTLSSRVPYGPHLAPGAAVVAIAMVVRTGSDSSLF